MAGDEGRDAKDRHAKMVYWIVWEDKVFVPAGTCGGVCEGAGARESVENGLVEMWGKTTEKTSLG